MSGSVAPIPALPARIWRASHIDRLKGLIGIGVPAEGFELLSPQDKENIRTQYEGSKRGIEQLIETFRDRGISMLSPTWKTSQRGYSPTWSSGLRRA